MTRPNPILLGFLLSAIALSCAGPSRTPQQEKDAENRETVAKELKEEQEVGRLMAAKLAGHLGSYDKDEALIRYLNLVGKTVAAQSSRPEITYRFGVLKTEDVNAFATPGGYIYITLGMLRSMQSESELAGIFGHEIAHVTERHMYKTINPKKDVSAGETITRMLSRGGSDIGYSMGKVVNAGIDILLKQGLGQEIEQEADAVGIIFSSSAGYAPSSLYDYLSRLQGTAASVKVSKTHPPFPQRLAALKAFMEKHGATNKTAKADNSILNTRFMTAMVKLPKPEKKK